MTFFNPQPQYKNFKINLSFVVTRYFKLILKYSILLFWKNSSRYFNSLIGVGFDPSIGGGLDNNLSLLLLHSEDKCQTCSKNPAEVGDSNELEDDAGIVG